MYEVVIPQDTAITLQSTVQDSVYADDAVEQSRLTASVENNTTERPTNIFDFLLTLTDKIIILVETLSPLLLPLITWYMQKNANKTQPSAEVQQ